MTRAAIYTRVSTDTQAERHTSEQQLVACREHCEAKAHEIVAELRDEGVSGTTPFEERPEGKHLLELAEAKAIDQVVTLCVDRLARDVVEGALIRSDLAKFEVELDFVTQSFDSTPEGEFMYHSFLNMAQFERALIARRTKRGRKASFANGKHVLSHVPYGFTKKDSGELAEHLEHAAVVRRMFNMSASGLGIIAIATALNSDGVPPPSIKARDGWSHTTVHKILTARRYIGEVKYAGEKRQGLTLIDEALFARVQLGLKGRRQYIDPAREKDLHLLAGLLRCRTCGGRYHAVHWRGSKRYFCATAKREGKKVRHADVKSWWKPEELEEQATRFISDFMEDPAAVLSLILEWHEDHKGLASEDPLPGLEAALGKHDEERKNIIRLARKSRIEEADMVEQLAEVKRAKAETETQIAEAKAARVVDPGEVEVVGALIRKRDETFILNHEANPSGWDPQMLQAALRHVVETIWVENDGTLTAESRYLEQDQLLRNQSHTPSWSRDKKVTKATRFTARLVPVM